MPLTPEEELELQTLEKDVGGLTPEESKELESLERELSSQQSPKDQVMQEMNRMITPPKPEVQKASRDAMLNQILLGYLPQAKGAIGALTGKDYTKARDEAITEMELEKQKFPEDVKGAELAGMIAPTGTVLRGAKGLIGMIGRGAALGAAINPGDVEGQVDPIQAEERGMGAVKGGLIAGALGAAAVPFKWLANKSKMFRKVKTDPHALQKETKADIQQAKDTIQTKHIDPTKQQLGETLYGKEVTVNLKDVIPAAGKEERKVIKMLRQGGVEEAQTDALQAWMAKQKLDKKAKYLAKTSPYDPKSQAKIKRYKQSADKLRKSLEQVDPNVKPLNQKIGELSSINEELGKGIRRDPVSTIKPGPVNKRTAVVKEAEKLSGVPLTKKGEQIRTAEKQQIKFPTTLGEAASIPIKVIERMGQRAGEIVEPVTSAVTSPTVQEWLIKQQARKK